MEVLDLAVGLLKQREELLRDVNQGIEQLERGEGGPLDMEEIKAAIRPGRTAARKRNARRPDRSFLLMPNAI
jgi:hypothetical protein